MNKLRLRFSKTGKAIYISHLDLMRTMQRSFARAELRFKYSEGFNPHPQMSVLLPLGVGCASVCELMDFTLTEDVPPEEIVSRLSRALPEGLTPLDCYAPERKVKELKFLRISGVFEYGSRPAEPMCAGLTEYFGREAIVITKRTKRGEGESDIRPAIREISFAAGENAVTLSAVISAQEPTLNPDNLTAALRQLAPELAPDFAKFRREETYDADMTVFR